MPASCLPQCSMLTSLNHSFLTAKIPQYSIPTSTQYISCLSYFCILTSLQHTNLLPTSLQHICLLPTSPQQTYLLLTLLNYSVPISLQHTHPFAYLSLAYLPLAYLSTADTPPAYSPQHITIFLPTTYLTTAHLTYQSTLTSLYILLKISYGPTVHRRAKDKVLN